MFVDKVNVIVKAGKGGNGALSFRREKFISKGGPDGGDGGDGGSVIFLASTNENTLAAFRHNPRLEARPGGNGSKRRKHGKSGDDLIVKVPVGTIISDENGKLIADLTQDAQTAIVAQGGKGGFGNAHFVSSTRQAPKFAEKGEAVESKNLTLELKIIADVGLIGLPNAGKSTMLANLSNAKPAIADYPFTTLTPHLGVVDFQGNSFLLADIPGLIAGASEGRGLGDQFLRHVERTSILLHLIDVYNDDLIGAYKTIQDELRAYKPELVKRPQIVVLTKIEGLDDDLIKERMSELKKVIPARTKVFAVSSLSRAGISDLLEELMKVVKKRQEKIEKDKEKELPVFRLPNADDVWSVKKIKGGYIVEGKKIEEFAGRTEFNNNQAVARLRDIMSKTGITHELIRKGIKSGDIIKIGDHGQFEY